MAEGVSDRLEGLKVDESKKEEETGEDEDEVNPWAVKTTSEKGIDYDKLISKL